MFPSLSNLQYLYKPKVIEAITVSLVAYAGVTKKAMVYFSQETKQRWSSSPAEQELAEEQGEIDGGALWLPGNTLLELQMLPMVSVSIDVT